MKRMIGMIMKKIAALILLPFKNMKALTIRVFRPGGPPSYCYRDRMYMEIYLSDRSDDRVLFGLISFIVICVVFLIVGLLIG